MMKSPSEVQTLMRHVSDFQSTLSLSLSKIQSEKEIIGMAWDHGGKDREVSRVLCLVWQEDDILSLATVPRSHNHDCFMHRGTRFSTAHSCPLPCLRSNSHCLFLPIKISEAERLKNAFVTQLLPIGQESRLILCLIQSHSQGFGWNHSHLDAHREKNMFSYSLSCWWSSCLHGYLMPGAMEHGSSCNAMWDSWLGLHRASRRPSFRRCFISL